MSDTLPSNVQSSSAPRRRSRGWVWFFAILVVLTIVAISVQTWYNLSQQLTVQKLEEAEQRWKRLGPRDYDMEYTIRKPDGNETYRVQVRGGKVVSSTRDGLPEETRLYHYRDMPALFSFIQEFLTRDHQPDSPRAYASASFDPEDGHLIHYVRSVMVTRERQEINVQLRAVGNP